MKGPTHRHVAHRSDVSRAEYDEERAAKIKHLEGVQEEHFRLVEMFFDEMKDGDTVTLTYGRNTIQLMRVPPK